MRNWSWVFVFAVLVAPCYAQQCESGYDIHDSLDSYEFYQGRWNGRLTLDEDSCLVVDCSKPLPFRAKIIATKHFNFCARQPFKMKLNGKTLRGFMPPSDIDYLRFNAGNVGPVGNYAAYGEVEISDSYIGEEFEPETGGWRVTATYTESYYVFGNYNICNCSWSGTVR